jgi:short-subunit dehydrogenase
MDLDRYGPWALIVGGSEGVGAGFARKLAAAGFNIVLVARKPGPLEELAQELRGKGAEVRTASVDMSKPDALDKVRQVTDDVEVGFLIYNAGANSVRGNFVELDPEVYRTVIGVNVIGMTEFVRHYGGLMRQRERGGIITTGSLAGYMGNASLASYCGSKAFSRIFTEAVWAECEPFNVDVLHLNIGFTATPAMARLNYDLTTAQDPADTAQEGLDNIRNGPVWICGGAANQARARESAAAEPRADAIRAVVPPPRK